MDDLSSLNADMHALHPNLLAMLDTSPDVVTCRLDTRTSRRLCRAARWLRDSRSVPLPMFVEVAAFWADAQLRYHPAYTLRVATIHRMLRVPLITLRPAPRTRMNADVVWVDEMSLGASLTEAYITAGLSPRDAVCSAVNWFIPMMEDALRFDGRITFVDKNDNVVNIQKGGKLITL